MENQMTKKEQDIQTKKFVEMLQKHVKAVGFNNARDIVVNKLDPWEHDKVKCIERVEAYLNDLESLQYESFGNDIARYLLTCLPPKYKSELPNLNEHNYDSYKDSCYQYVPVKNGQNILKHGLAFPHIEKLASKEFFGRLAVPVKVGKDRKQDGFVVYSKINNVNSYILSIVDFPDVVTENQEDEQAKLKALDYLKANYLEESKQVGRIDMFEGDMKGLIDDKTIKRIANNTEPKRFISAWIFDPSRFDVTVMERIVGTDPDPKVVQEIKDRSVALLRKAWGVNIK